MTEESDKIASFLRAAGIPIREYKPGGTFPPSKKYWEDNRLRRCKNIFFRDNHGKNHYLVVLDFDEELNIDRLKDLTGKNTLSFASPERLKKYLNQEPGSVSVLGIIHDKTHKVQVVIDQNLNDERMLTFLPGKRGWFYGLTFQELKSFIEAAGHEYRVERVY